MAKKRVEGRRAHPRVSVPKLMIEFHYDDGDVGAYEVEDDLLTSTPADLWTLFSSHTSHRPHHIVLRPQREDG